MSRKNARESSFKLLFSSFFHGVENPQKAEIEKGIEGDIFKNFCLENTLEKEEDIEFCQSLLNKTLAHKAELLQIIDNNLVGYHIDKVYKIDLAILMLATCELKFVQEVNSSVIINEAVEIAKKYSTDKSFSFINGVLAKIIKGETDGSSNV